MHKVGEGWRIPSRVCAEHRAQGRARPNNPALTTGTKAKSWTLQRLCPTAPHTVES